MAHREQEDFCIYVRWLLPVAFACKTVLDIGSLDINGNNRKYFFGGAYTGVDVAPGLNVDVVSPAHELAYADGSFDTVISTECLEHDMHWDKTLRNAVRMLRPGGLLLFTCATTGRPEHGTRASFPKDAPLLEGEWADYYRNLTESDIRTAIDVDKVFPSHEFRTNQWPCDLYFWGLKA